MIIRRAEDIRPSEITPHGAYLNRRQLIGAATALSLGSLLARTVRADALVAAKGRPSTDETPTALKYVTSYNNYYEFGTDKSDPGQNAHSALPISAATRDFEITLSLVDYI
jgi:sulfoxide reductase catalytic subunit YedY